MAPKVGTSKQKPSVPGDKTRRPIKTNSKMVSSVINDKEHDDSKDDGHDSDAKGSNDKLTPAAFKCTCDPECDCDGECECTSSGHTEQKECIIEKNWTNHLSMVGKHVTTSTYCRIKVAEQGRATETFTIHETLLALHSGRDWFKNRIDEIENPGVHEDEIIRTEYTFTLDKGNVRASHFAFFHAWLYTGAILDTELFATHNLTVELWELGARLRAPGFQNCVMDKVRAQYGDPEIETHYMDEKTIDGIYRTTRKGSLMRILVVDIMGRFKVMNSSKYEYKSTWTKLMQKHPDLKQDYTLACRKKWKANEYPWDEAHRAKYMVEEEPLDDRWEKQILKADKDIVEREGDESVKGMLELDHLKMMKQMSGVQIIASPEL